MSKNRFFSKLKAAVASAAAVVMAVGTIGAVPAAAEVKQTNLTVEIKSAYSDRTYNAYQIFKGDINTNTDGDDTDDSYADKNTRILSNVEWADGMGETTKSAIITELNKVASVKTAYNTLKGTTGQDIPSTGTPATAADLADAIAKAGIEYNSADAQAVAKAFYTALGIGTNSAVVATATTNSGTSDNATTPTYTYTLGSTSTDGGNTKLEAGYYIIVDATELSSKTDESTSALLLNVVGNTKLTEKAVKPTSSKAVQDEAADEDKNSQDSDGYGDTADHNINEQFSFKLTATLPDDADYASYSTYPVTFNDTFSEGITYERIDSVSVTSDGKTYSVNKYTITTKVDGENGAYTIYTAAVGSSETTYSGTTYSSSEDTNGTAVSGEISAENFASYVNTATLGFNLSIADLKTLQSNDVTPSTIDLTKGATVTVVYKAHLNENAYVTKYTDTNPTTTNKNTVDLTYINNPTTNGTGKTAEKTTYVFTYEVDNRKIAGPGTTVEASTEVTVAGSKVALSTKTSDAPFFDDAGNYYTYDSNNTTWTKFDVLSGVGFTLYKTREGNEGSYTYKDAVKLIDNADGTYTVAASTATLTENPGGQKNEVVEKMKSSTTGLFNIKGLDNGTYYLVETGKPDGYNDVAPLTVVISAEHEVDSKSKAAKVTFTRNGTESSNMNNVITNVKGSVLPGTGGAGRFIYLGFGAAGLAAVIALLVAKKRKNA